MKAQELRIGNYYMIDGRCFKMDIKMMYAFCSGSFLYDIDKILGIPLTEDILLKCGFTVKSLIDIEQDRITVYHHEKLGYLSRDFAYAINDTNEYCEMDNLLKLSVPMNYIHQLQNLFHSITGEELEVKL